jgi:hypothetical protein
LPSKPEQITGQRDSGGTGAMVDDGTEGASLIAFRYSAPL